MADISLTNSLTSFFYFIIVTLAYFILKIFAKSQQMIMILTITYFVTVLITQFFINVSISNQLCGSSQYETAAIVTFIPWILMLGSIKMLITVFPGWLSPFSNTFGYLVTKLLGIGNVLNDILSGKFDKENVSDSMKIASEALEHIYADNSLLINEITPENFDAFWEKMTGSGLFKKNADQFKDKLQRLVNIKDNVSAFIWYILTGGLVTSISYNYMVNAECTKSIEQIQNVTNVINDTKLSKDNTTKRLYTSFE